MTGPTTSPQPENPDPSGDFQADGKNPTPSENNPTPTAGPSGSDGKDKHDDPFPDISRRPGFISVFDPQISGKAGLESLDALKARYSTYASVITDAKAVRASLDADQWAIVLNKARIGGLITVAKFMTKGSKAAVARDFNSSEDTANRWERLYKYLGWAFDTIRAEAQAATAKGADYQYSIDHIISEGEKAAERAGATVRRAKHFGAGKCLLIDPAQRTATVDDLPTNFSVSKVKRQHWAEIERVQFGSGIRAWQEVDKDAGERGLRFFKIDGTAFKVRHLIIARISKKNEILELGDATKLMRAIDYDAREPRDVPVIAIDPTTGSIKRTTVKDDLLIGGSARPTTMDEPFDGLSLRETEPQSQFLFTLADQQFRGPSLIVRQEADTEWLLPVTPTLSVGDVACQVSFKTLDAVKATAGESIEDSDREYEVLTELLVTSYFPLPKGWLRGHPLFIALAKMEGQTWRSNDAMLRSPSGQARSADLARIIDGEAAWSVPRLRDLVDVTVAEVMTSKAEATADEHRAGPSEPPYIPLAEPEVVEILGVTSNALAKRLIAEDLAEDQEGELLPNEAAETRGHAFWDGDQWLWSVLLLRGLLAEPDPASGATDTAVMVDPIIDEPGRVGATVEESPLFEFTGGVAETATQIETPQLTRQQLAERVIELEQENRQLRAQLTDSEQRRIAAEERVALLQGRVSHLAGVTPRTQVLEYTLTVLGDRGEHLVWRSQDAATTQPSAAH